MTTGKASHIQWYAVAATTLFASAHLAWESTHGGVLSHHLFANPEMPALSNWWGLIILPVLGWAASWFALRRGAEHARVPTGAIVGAAGALLVGVALSVGFTTGYEQVSSYLFFGALLSGLIVPIYRAEYVFGFVVGMTLTFGAVLPTLFALIGAALSALSHFLIRPPVAWALRRLRA